MTRIAHLPMYDPPEARAATDALWRCIAGRLRQAGLVDVPDDLARHLSEEQSWHDPRLLLGQSCGYPAMHAFRQKLRIVATPLYAAPGCDGPSHCSVFVVAADSPATTLADLRGGSFALNSWHSNTGMNLPRLAIAPLARGGRFFSQVIETGSHAASLARVAAGEADAAAIDCVTHALLARHRPQSVAGTRILARTAASPALPFVTSSATDDATVALLRETLLAACIDPDLAASRESLFLTGAVAASGADYAVVLDYEARAQQLDYAVLS